MTKTVLILGATGGVGGETARALRRHGWQVRALARTLPADRHGFDWVQGDALDRDALVTAAAGIDAIVHAVNPPGYQGWDTVGRAMLENTIAAAQASGARIAFPGNVYVYDPARTPLASVDSAQRPRTRKGAIRVGFEERLRTAGVRGLILRCGDFFGPQPGGSWFSQGMITPGKPIKSIMKPVIGGAGHAWAYLPDVGETFARLLDRDAELPDFARFHFDGVWDDNGMRIIDAVARAIGNTDLKVRRMPWWALPLAAPFNTMMREMAEMKPLWAHPLRLDNRDLVAFLGEEPHTPLDRAIATTLGALGCLDAAPLEKGVAFA